MTTDTLTTKNNNVELSRLDEINYLTFAIKTELYINRDRIHLFMDFDKNHQFIQELSEKITKRAQNIREITEFVLQEDAAYEMNDAI